MFIENLCQICEFKPKLSDSRYVSTCVNVSRHVKYYGVAQVESAKLLKFAKS